MRLIDADVMKTISEIQMGDFNSFESIRKWIDRQPTVKAVPTEDKPKTYERGLEDAWELAIKVNEMSEDQIKNCFESHDKGASLMHHWTAVEAMQKLQEWEDKQIKFGDVVEIFDRAGTGFVTFIESISGKEVIHVMYSSGRTASATKDLIKKTGRNVADKLNALLEEIGGQQDGEV